MRLVNALDDIFAGRSEVRVLRALEELPEGLAVSARELARRSGLSHPTVSNVLAGLTDQGVVQARRAPRGDPFELNRRHALSERLRSLFDWERQLLREFVIFVAGQIRRRAPRVSAAYLFGSAVRGEMTADSDVDLAVIVLNPADATGTSASLMEVAEAVRLRYGNRLDVTIGLSAINELQHSRRPGHRLWATVAREGIPVIEAGKPSAFRQGPNANARA